MCAVIDSTTYPGASLQVVCGYTNVRASNTFKKTLVQKNTCAHTHTHWQGDIRMVLRAAISMNKRRFIDKASDINLDLTYICDRLIAMALPCVADAVYRNNIRDVAHFFSSRHYGRCVVPVCRCVCMYMCVSTSSRAGTTASTDRPTD